MSLLPRDSSRMGRDAVARGVKRVTGNGGRARATGDATGIRSRKPPADSRKLVWTFPFRMRSSDSTVPGGARSSAAAFPCSTKFAPKAGLLRQPAPFYAC